MLITQYRLGVWLSGRVPAVLGVPPQCGGNKPTPMEHNHWIKHFRFKNEFRLAYGS